MNRLAMYLGSLALAGLLAAQLIQPPVSASTRTGRNLLADPSLPPQVRSILERSCVDCHSGEAHMPWYGKVSPVSWMVADHVTRGRKKLDFSDWPRNDYSLRQDIADSVENHSMPLRSYCWMHRQAPLSENDIRILDAWADAH